MDTISISKLFSEADSEYVESFVERFNDKIDRSGDCHIWQAQTNNWGHGRIRFKREKLLAHRVAYFLEHGEPSEQVNHECGRPDCMNPSHLYDGTQKDNAQDMVQHGNQHLQELSVDDVREIRRRIEKGETQTSVAEDYPIGQPQVSRIVNEERWSHI